MADGNGPGAILDVADLAAPSVVEALPGPHHPHHLGGRDRFRRLRHRPPRDGTLREIYGDLAPVAIIRGDNSETPGEVIACPGRDVRVHAGDWTAMIGTADELAAQGIAVARPIAPLPGRRPLFVRRSLDARPRLRDDLNPMFYRALAVSTTRCSCVDVPAAVHLQPTAGMSWVDALYFSAETIATVGYGDFNFIEQPTWLRLFGMVLMFAGVTTTAILVAFVADVLLSRRLVAVRRPAEGAPPAATTSSWSALAHSASGSPPS